MSGERPLPPQQPRSGPLGSLRRVLQSGVSSLLHNGYLKLGALLVALVFWVFVHNDNALITQRTVRAPLNVEGLGAGQLALGLPDRVEVRLSGPASRVRAINPEGIDAVLNLRGVSGDFEEDVRVFPPQGISLVGVNPREIIGTVELRVSKRVPARAVLLSPEPAGAVIEASAQPGEVAVSGAESLVNQVTQVLVPFNAQSPRDRAAAYAADQNGNPVEGVSVAPRLLRLEAQRSDVLHTKRVPVTLAPVSLPGLEVGSAQLTQPEIAVAGPQAALADLNEVRATLPETPQLTPGQYTLGVTLDVPEGVVALEPLQLELQLRAPRRAPGGDTTD